MAGTGMSLLPVTTVTAPALSCHPWCSVSAPVPPGFVKPWRQWAVSSHGAGVSQHLPMANSHSPTRTHTAHPGNQSKTRARMLH